MRTGFAIATIAGTFKKNWIVGLGVIMILVSAYQYYYLTKSLEDETLKPITYLDHFPLIYIILSLGALYLQFYKPNK